MDAAIVSLVFFLLFEGINVLVSSFLDSTSGLGFQIVWILACMPLSWGFVIVFLDFIRGGELSSGNLFAGYKDCLRIGIAYLLNFLAIFVGSIFLIVPGIIFGMMFAQTPYILRDNESISAIDAMKQSARMMSGHKMDLFLLYLSFIGWVILAFLTLGIGFLFLAPYLNTTVAHYYEDLKKQNF
jgi:uncharacterized membrane protein